MEKFGFCHGAAAGGRGLGAAGLGAGSKWFCARPGDADGAVLAAIYWL